MVAAFVELWSLGQARLVPLDAGRITVGRAPENDVVVDDPEASAIHASLEPLAGSWAVRDLSSRNGTFVNGERIVTERPLRRGDEIRIGRSRLIYRPEAENTRVDPTVTPQAAPELTRREREVLLALVGGRRPAQVFVEPATTREIATALSVTDAAVKQHLVNLYNKFALTDAAERTRARLANEAIRRGVITIADLEAGRPQA